MIGSDHFSCFVMGLWLVAYCWEHFLLCEMSFSCSFFYLISNLFDAAVFMSEI